MSTYVMSDYEIATIARTFAPLAGLTECAVQALADELKRENIRSVNHYYGKRLRITACDISAYMVDATLADLAVLVEDLDYQSCERPDYEKSKAYNAINQIRAALIAHRANAGALTRG